VANKRFSALPREIRFHGRRVHFFRFVGGKMGRRSNRNAALVPLEELHRSVRHLGSIPAGRSMTADKTLYPKLALIFLFSRNQRVAENSPRGRRPVAERAPYRFWIKITNSSPPYLRQNRSADTSGLQNVAHAMLKPNSPSKCRKNRWTNLKRS